MRKSSLPAWLRALRPAQWLKNGVVPAALFFAWRDPSQGIDIHNPGVFIAVGLAVACFCFISSAIYLINDIKDVEADRAHPVKALRPIASGELSSHTALLLAIALLITGGLLSLRLPALFTWIISGYALMQCVYTFGLKRIPYVDVFIIAIGFVFRAVAGAVAISVRISPWLLLCTFLLALFLALCKRRHEKGLFEEKDTRHRQALTGYTRQLLDSQIAITAAATIVCYAIYTLAPETVHRFGTSYLGMTIPFVVFGVFRYLALVYTHDEGGRPEKVMLTDKTLIITVLCYIGTALIILLTAHPSQS
jgi:4-hydroxybenzoate polyprenyltransferase